MFRYEPAIGAYQEAASLDNFQHFSLTSGASDSGLMTASVLLEEVYEDWSETRSFGAVYSNFSDDIFSGRLEINWSDREGKWFCTCFFGTYII